VLEICTMQDMLFSQPQPSLSGSDAALTQYGYDMCCCAVPSIRLPSSAASSSSLA